MKIIPSRKKLGYLFMINLLDLSMAKGNLKKKMKRPRLQQHDS